MRHLIFTLFIFFNLQSFAAFEDHFENKSLRIDYYHSGNDTSEIYTIDELIEEPYWGGSKVNLIDKFDYGKYKFEVYDLKSGKLVYSRGYSSLFAEWQTTREAGTTWKSFQESIVFPFPKKNVKVEFYSRDKKNKWGKRFEYIVDPDDIFIKKETHKDYDNFKIHFSGDPATHLDIVIIPDGYTKKQMKKFRKDSERFKDILLGSEPFSENTSKINIWCVKAYSRESGPDEPGKNIWKNTLVNTNFYTFGSERYLTTKTYKQVRNIAAYAPYDQIYILVNTEKYGGGGIYNFYSVCSSDNAKSDFVFIHEFGHAFAGLGDEYYTSDVAVEDFYPLDVEPWEPNLTTLVEFETKWKDKLSTTTPVPTPVNDNFKNTIGVYEGGGYKAKGVFRPFIDCTMKSAKYNNFCPVCKSAIQEMIEFYSE
ncbi:MAG: IgA Peptidase M64 [Bacteroidales bacterium]|nr:IgA Peptidase M64 [Bacteroidales bacterium]